MYVGIMGVFNLREGQDFIELLKLLKVKGWVQTGGHAKIVIDEGEVKVNGKTEYRKRNKLRKGDIIEYDGQTITIA